MTENSDRSVRSDCDNIVIGGCLCIFFGCNCLTHAATYNQSDVAERTRFRGLRQTSGKSAETKHLFVSVHTIIQVLLSSWRPTSCWPQVQIINSRRRTQMAKEGSHFDISFVYCSLCWSPVLSLRLCYSSRVAMTVVGCETHASTTRNIAPSYSVCLFSNKSMNRLSWHNVTDCNCKYEITAEMPCCQSVSQSVPHNALGRNRGLVPRNSIHGIMNGGDCSAPQSAMHVQCAAFTNQSVKTDRNSVLQSVRSPYRL